MNVHRLFFTIFLGRILPSFEKKARPGKKIKSGQGCDPEGSLGCRIK